MRACGLGVFALVALLCTHEMSTIKASNKYELVGCYRDGGGKARPMQQIIANYRDRFVKWSADEFTEIIETCAAAAQRQGYLYFSIQYFGECWSGPQAHMTYDKDGRSDKCTFGVGQDWVNSVYRLLGEERECSSATYRQLSDADRAVSHQLLPGVTPKCDFILPVKARWYRFAGAAGNVMATSCPPLNHCGTIGPGWMRGDLPYDVIDKAVKKMVCFHQQEDCCFRTVPISVRNCGRFFVFKLPRAPTCQLRYCGANRLI